MIVITIPGVHIEKARMDRTLACLHSGLFIVLTRSTIPARLTILAFCYSPIDVFPLPCVPTDRLYRPCCLFLTDLLLDSFSRLL
jgi:hypothetical protein